MRLFTIGDQILVEVGVRANDRHMRNSRRERDFINGCTKFNFTAEEVDKFGTDTISSMGKADRERAPHAGPSAAGTYGPIPSRKTRFDADP